MRCCYEKIQNKKQQQTSKVPLEISDAKSAGFFSFSQYNINYEIGLFKLLYSSYIIVNISIKIFLNDTQIKAQN